MKYNFREENRPEEVDLLLPPPFDVTWLASKITSRC